MNQSFREIAILKLNNSTALSSRFTAHPSRTLRIYEAFVLSKEVRFRYYGCMAKQTPPVIKRTLVLTEEISVENFLVNFFDYEYFHSLCRQCPRYGQTWSCPPFSEDIKLWWQQFAKLRVIAKKLYLRKDLVANLRMEALDSLFSKEKKSLRRTLHTWEQAIPASRALFAGHCEVCATCARVSGKVCLKPDKLRPSLEAYGADIGKILSDVFAETLVWSDPGELPPYIFIVGGLAIPSGSD